MKVVKILAVITSLILISAFFLPYTALNEEEKAGVDMLNALSISEIESVAEKNGIPLSEVKDGSLSVFDFCHWAFDSWQSADGDDDEALASVIVIATYGIVGLFAVLAFLCSLGKKPTLLFLLSVATFVCDQKIMHLYCTKRLLESAWHFTIASVLYPVTSAILAVLAIVMFVLKHQEIQQKA